MEALSFQLTCEDKPSVEYMARFIATKQQSYTQRGGVRPFGVSCMLSGFTNEGAPQLYLTDPAGTYSSWKVRSIYYCWVVILSANKCCVGKRYRRTQ